MASRCPGTSKPTPDAIAISASATARPPSETSWTPAEQVVGDQAADERAQAGVGLEVEGGQLAAAVAPEGRPPRSRPEPSADGSPAAEQQELAAVDQADARRPAVEHVDQPDHAHHRRGVDVAPADSL